MKYMVDFCYMSLLLLAIKKYEKVSEKKVCNSTRKKHPTHIPEQLEEQVSALQIWFSIPALL